MEKKGKIEVKVESAGDENTGRKESVSDVQGRRREKIKKI